MLLGSESGRKMLATTRTVIVDEIHALAPNKRGSHLALSLERLAALDCHRLPCASGLSATQKPIEEVARYLVGDAGERGALLDRRCRTRARARSRPRGPAGAARSGHVRRGLAAGLRAARGADAGASHHARLRQHAAHGGARGAASFRADRQGRRHRAPRQPRQGAAVRRRAAAEKRPAARARRHRVARARHRHRRRRARLPARHAALDRDVPAARRPRQSLGRRAAEGATLSVVARRARRMRGAARCRAARRARSPRDPAEAARRARAADRGRGGGRANGAKTRCSATFTARLSVCDVDARRVSRRRAHGRRRLHARVAVIARRTCIATRSTECCAAAAAPGSRRITSGGAIPDTADYDVVLEPAGQLVGTVNEDFAIESLAGDIFQLGNTSYRILRVEAGRIRVDDAQGQPPTIPFWLGEAPGRTDELSTAVSRLREDVEARLDNATALDYADARARARRIAGRAARRVSRGRARRARRAADAEDDRARALLRRIRRHAARHPQRRSAAASTARGVWRCASASAASSISSCRRRRPKTRSCCRSPRATAFRWTTWRATCSRRACARC